MKRRWYLLALVLLVSFLAACNNATSLPATPTPTRNVKQISMPTSQPVNSPIVGIYTATITRKDIASVDLTRNAAAGSDVQPGTWVLTFRSDGYYTALGGNYPEGTSYIGAGPYQLMKNQMTINDGKCEEFYLNGRTAVYSWSLQGKSLTLSAISDTCTARILVMTSHAWQRQS